MARKYLTDLDLNQNSLNNAVVQNLASAPSSPKKGQIYFDTTLTAYRYYDGSAWQNIGDTSGTVTSVSVATANGFSGTVATASSTPAITMQTTVTGLLKGNGTAISGATSGTDYAPATSGSSALKGNGSGGFSTATINDLGAQTADYSASSHKITNLTDPTNPQDAATKNYVDTTAQGLSAKDSVAAATTAALPANTYANGSSGVGATLTASANGALAVDGYTVQANDRLLVQNEATASHNGLYTVTATGGASAAYVLTRASDFNQSAEVAGAYVFVENGTTNADAGFVCTTTGTVTFGTTNIAFTQFSGAGEIIAGTGLSKSGNTISLSTPVAVSNGGTGAGTITGLVKGNGTSAFSAAVSGTDYAPATSGSSILKGNGSGGFSSAKFTATIGDASSTSIAVTHSLGTQDVVAQVRDASTNAVVECDITLTSTTVTTFGFATAPALNSLKVVIIG